MCAASSTLLIRVALDEMSQLHLLVTHHQVVYTRSIRGLRAATQTPGNLRSLHTTRWVCNRGVRGSCVCEGFMTQCWWHTETRSGGGQTLVGQLLPNYFHFPCCLFAVVAVALQLLLLLLISISSSSVSWTCQLLTSVISSLHWFTCSYLSEYLNCVRCEYITVFITFSPCSRFFKVEVSFV